jgi:hypothetical protein
MSSHEILVLPFPQIPARGKVGHIFDAVQQPLLSMGQFCDVGCKATFDAEKVVITRNDQIILTGQRDFNGLWTIPIPRPIHQANFSVYDTTTKQMIKYLHLCLWSPTKSTILKALANNQFVGWPAFNSDSVRKHLRRLEVPTILGHMDQQRKNIRSTKPQHRLSASNNAPNDNDVFVPPGPAISDGQQTHDVVCAVRDLPTGKIYTDQTGLFPVVSSRGVNAVMVLYDYDSNAIITEGSCFNASTQPACDPNYKDSTTKLAEHTRAS